MAKRSIHRPMSLPLQPRTLPLKPMTESSPSEIPADADSESPGSDSLDGPASSSGPIRKGSPFASQNPKDSESLESRMPASEIHPHELLDPEWGVLRSAIWASAWVAIFSIACWRFFPGGGVVVASLGCGLAIVGLFSSRPIPATALLITHVAFFFGCYQQLF